MRISDWSSDVCSSDLPDGVKVGFTQIAGLVARRIVKFAKVGDIVVAGQRIGLIRFGSRVDVFLPSGTAPKVVLGQRAIAGETVLGIIGDSRSEEHTSELQSLMRISYAVFCLKKKNNHAHYSKYTCTHKN